MGRILIVLLLLSACGPAHKLRKAERLMNEAIAQGAKVKTDTVYLTKVIEGPKTTEFIPIDRLRKEYRDTTIYQDRIKLHYVTLHDTLRLTVDCPTDTIRVPVTVHKSIICPDCPKDRMWRGVGFGAGGLLILLILFALARLIKA